MRTRNSCLHGNVNTLLLWSEIDIYSGAAPGRLPRTMRSKKLPTLHSEIDNDSRSSRDWRRLKKRPTAQVLLAMVRCPSYVDRGASLYAEECFTRVNCEVIAILRRLQDRPWPWAPHLINYRKQSLPRLTSKVAKPYEFTYTQQLFLINLYIRYLLSGISNKLQTTAKGEKHSNDLRAMSGEVTVKHQPTRSTRMNFIQWNSSGAAPVL